MKRDKSTTPGETVLDWDALMELAKTANGWLNVETWRGRHGFDRWALVVPSDPEEGWRGKLELRAVPEGSQVVVLLERPPRTEVFCSVLSTAGSFTEDTVEALARDLAARVVELG